MAHVALVTGANRGLGREIARQLLAQGLHVVMTGRDEAATHRALGWPDGRILQGSTGHSLVKGAARALGQPACTTRYGGIGAAH